MKLPARSGAARFIRARGVVAYWNDDRFVLVNFMAGTRVAAPAVAMRVLDLCTKPQTVTAIERALPEFRPADVRRLIGDLRRLKLLENCGRGKPSASADGGWEGWNPAAGFFHFSTKDVAFPKSPRAAEELWKRLGPSSPMPSSVKHYPHGRRIALPKGGEPDSFAKVLLSRRTWREFSRAPIDLDRLSTVLRLTWGIQHWATVRGEGDVALKTSPSGGARHAGEVYVLARRVSGLAPGLYHYDPENKLLVPLAKHGRLPAIGDLLPGQPWYRGAPVLFIMTAVFERAQWRYGFPRAYRAVLIEAGHLCQTCCLVATSLGLAPFCSMAFPDTRIEKMLGLDGVTESALYIAGVGVPPAAGWRPWSEAGGSTHLVGD